MVSPDCNKERPRAIQSRTVGSEEVGHGGRVGVLVSAGLDSSVRLAELSRETDEVHPIYVRCGLRWEPAEEKALAAFCEAIRTPALQATIRLEQGAVFCNTVRIPPRGPLPG